jgi:hypothetical protein
MLCAWSGVVMIRLVCVKHSHASFLLELPAPPAAKRGPRVLFDPVFSEHCADRAAAIASFWKTRRRTGLVGLLPQPPPLTDLLVPNSRALSSRRSGRC